MAMPHASELSSSVRTGFLLNYLPEGGGHAYRVFAVRRALTEGEKKLFLPHASAGVAGAVGELPLGAIRFVPSRLMGGVIRNSFMVRFNPFRAPGVSEDVSRQLESDTAGRKLELMVLQHLDRVLNRDCVLTPVDVTLTQPKEVSLFRARLLEETGRKPSGKHSIRHSIRLVA